MNNQGTPLLIVGTRAAARIALDLALALDLLVYGFISTESSELGQEMNDVPVLALLGSPESKKLLTDKNAQVAVAVYDGAHRHEVVALLRKVRKEIASLIHPQALLSAYSRIGAGNVCHAGVVVGPNCELGDYNVLQYHSVLECDVVMGSYCTLQSGVKVGREAFIDDGVFIGAGAVIQAKVRIGAGAVVAPGAVVLRDVPEGGKVHGNPAVEQ